MKLKILLPALVAVGMSTSLVYAEDIKSDLVSVIAVEGGKNLLADPTGKTLYIFDLDKGASACTGDCAELWPPILVTAAEIQKIKAPLGTIQRANRKMQLTYDGMPLYSYAFDRVQGNEFGDGIGNVWHEIVMH